MNPKFLFPEAKTVIGFVFRIPRGVQRGIEEGTQFYQYWSCAVYYRGAHKSNPFMTEDFLKGDPRREAILNGEYKFDRESAREIYPELGFLPRTQWGYAPCLCSKKCDIACYRHIAGKEI